MNDRLTIFLPLRGRHLHTLRWLWHADRTSLPFPVIVADGDVNPTIEHLVTNERTFPRLNVTYLRYADRTFSDFHRKCAESLSLVRTPYVMMSDNDDFLFPSGIARSLSLLEERPDFVCSIGGVPGFETADPKSHLDRVVGPFTSLKYRCHDDGSYDPRNFDQDKASERVLSELRGFFSLYYSVYRTESLQLATREVMEIDFSDLLLQEFYLALRTLTLGKASAQGTFFSYLRQGNSSSRFSTNQGWLDHLLRSRFSPDFQELARRVASFSIPDNITSRDVLELEIYREFAKYLRAMLAGTVLRYRFPRLFQAKQALEAVRKKISPPRGWRLSRQEREFWRQLAIDGADAATIATHQEEMAEMQKTITGGEFVEFVMRNAPDLLAENALGCDVA